MLEAARACSGRPSRRRRLPGLRSRPRARAASRGPARLLVAARVGATRLIDNVPIRLGARRHEDHPSLRCRSCSLASRTRRPPSASSRASLLAHAGGPRHRHRADGGRVGAAAHRTVCQTGEARARRRRETCARPFPRCLQPSHMIAARFPRAHAVVCRPGRPDRPPPAHRQPSRSRYGPDRERVAAIDLLGPPCVVVDLGTATTFDVVNADGEYVGGVIAPGNPRHRWKPWRAGTPSSGRSSLSGPGRPSRRTPSKRCSPARSSASRARSTLSSAGSLRSWASAGELPVVATGTFADLIA